MNTKNNSVATYYSRFGSWAGYNMVLGRSQHAGYWTSETKNERQAQANFLRMFANELQLKPTDRVLDAGSGQGVMARHLVRANGGGEVIGITITPREVKISEKLSRHMNPAPRFVLGDYSHTDFPDEHFDVVYVNETLSHAKDMQATMQEFYRILKPGGRVAFADYEVDARHMSARQQRMMDFLEQHAGGFGVRQQNPGEISQALQQAGFADISETDWTEAVMPTYHRLRSLARPFAWIQPDAKLAPFFVNAVMASHGYSTLYEAGLFRYLLYKGTKPLARRAK